MDSFLLKFIVFFCYTCDGLHLFKNHPNKFINILGETFINIYPFCFIIIDTPNQKLLSCFGFKIF